MINKPISIFIIKLTVSAFSDRWWLNMLGKWYGTNYLFCKTKFLEWQIMVYIYTLTLCSILLIASKVSYQSNRNSNITGSFVYSWDDNTSAWLGPCVAACKLSASETTFCKFPSQYIDKLLLSCWRHRVSFAYKLVILHHIMWTEATICNLIIPTNSQC